MKVLRNKAFSSLHLKKKYSPPQFYKLGMIKNITLKTGSQPDFSGNFYQP
jgi:hypothetical protein